MALNDSLPIKAAHHDGIANFVVSQCKPR